MSLPKWVGLLITEAQCIDENLSCKTPNIAFLRALSLMASLNGLSLD
jgi:hypothetical protein